MVGFACDVWRSFNKNAILILLAIHGQRQAIRAVALAGLVVRAQTMVCARTTYAQSNHENDNFAKSLAIVRKDHLNTHKNGEADLKHITT